MSGGDTLEEATVSQIRSWGDSHLSSREKAALGFAERLFIDHQHIDQELFDDLHGDFTTEQIVELAWAIVSCMAYGRLIYSFGLSPDDLPVAHPVY